MKSILNNAKAIIFDLDNTVFEEALYFKEVVAYFCKIKNIEFNEKDLFDFFYIERGKSKNIINDILEKFLKLESTKRNRDALFNIYTNIKTHISTYDDTIEFINRLKLNKYRLGLLTNGVVEAQRNKVQCLNIESFFDVIVYARTWGRELEKPNEKSFSFIVKELKVQYKDCIFIGDNPNIDFKVPFENGAFTIRLLRGNHKDNPTNQFINKTVNNFNELIK